MHGAGSGGNEKNGPKDNKIVRYSGVSVRFLQELRLELLEEKVALGVALCILCEDLLVTTTAGKQVTLCAGSTIRLKKKLRNGNQIGRTKGVGAFTLPQDAPLQCKPRHKWSIEDVCEFVVLEETRDEKLFYLELMDEKDIGNRFQGTFLSQARKSCFCDLVQALQSYFEGKGSDVASQFVWFDVFCANQTLLTTRDEDLPPDIQKSREELLKAGLHEAIATFDDRLIYFNSWLEPYPIQRAWCVWEIFGCVKCEKPLDILFQPGEEEVFVQTLLQDRQKVTKRIMDIRLEDAQCFIESDKLEIDRAVDEQVGYHKLNVTISSLVQKWLKKFAVKVIQEQKEKLSSQNSVAYAEVLEEVGIFFLDQLGLHEEAISVLQESLHIRQEMLGTDALPVAYVRHAIANVLQEKGDYDTALEEYQHVLQIYEKAYNGRVHPNVANTLQNVAMILHDKGDFDTALERYDEVLRIKEKVYGGKENPDVAATLHEIARVLQDKGEYDAALLEFHKVLSIEEKAYGGRDHPQVASTLHNIALVLKAKSDYDAALEQYKEVLRIYERAFGGRNHPRVTSTLHNIASALHSKGDLVAALHQFQETLRIKENVYGGRNHPSIASTLHQIALVLQDKGEYDAALAQCYEVLSIQERAFGGRNHPSVASTLHSLAGILHDKGDFDKALEQYEAALCILGKAFGDHDHPDIASTLHNIAVTLKAKGELGAALKQHEHVLCIKEKTFGDRNHPRVASTLFSIASVLHHQGEYDAALKQYEQVLGIYEQAYADRTHPSVTSTLHQIAVVLQDKGEYQAALRQHKEILCLEEEKHGSRDHPDVASTLHEIASISYFMGDYEAALEQYEQVLGILERNQ